MTTEIPSGNGTVGDFPFERRGFIFNVIGCIVTIVIALTSIVGNVLVVFVTQSCEILRNQRGNALVVNLSCIDVVTATFVMLPSALAVGLDRWPFGEAACKAHAFLVYHLYCASLLNIAAISFDRAVAVGCPLRYASLITDEVIVVLRFLIFAISGACSVFVAGIHSVSYKYSEGFCNVDYVHDDDVYYAFSVSLALCLYSPSAVIAISYTTVVVLARKSRNAVRPVVCDRSGERRIRKTLTSVIVIAILFYLSFFPSLISKHVQMVEKIHIPPWFDYLSSIFAYSSSSINPFVYAIFRKDYRDCFHKFCKSMKSRVFS